MQTTTRAEFARHRNVSKAAVTQWDAAGRLVMTGDGRVDVRASETRLAQTMTGRGGKRRAGEGGGVQGGAEHSAPHGSLPGPVP